MRFWAYFAAKIAAAAAFLWGLYRLIDKIWPVDKHPNALTPLDNGGGILLYNIVFGVWFLLCAGALALIVLDQRRRCRTCLRRLRMPLGSGSRGSILLAQGPRTEYICPYGHGALAEEDLRLTGIPVSEWTASAGDLWEELCASSGKPSDKA